MSQHRQSFAIGEMAMPLMETPEQQEIIELKEQLEQEKGNHQKTKTQLEIELLDKASEVKELRNTIQCLALQVQKSSIDNFEAENKSEIQMMKMEFDKKFDDLKEQISKGQMQEELQKLRSENARLQDELSDSTTETKGLKESIEEFKESNAKKDEKVQELEETIRQRESKLDDLKKELSDSVDKFEKKDLKFEELKNKYEEAVVKLNGMDELQKEMKDLKLKHSQLQLQIHYQQLQQQQQQLDKKIKDNHIQTNSDSLHSKEVEECIFSYQRYLHAMLNNDSKLGTKFFDESNRHYNGLSKEDKEKCREIAVKQRDNFKQMSSK